MKFVIAPDSFKESMSATEAAQAMGHAVKRVFPSAEILLLPVADGGEGTLESLTFATGGKLFEVTVTGPLGEKQMAKYAILGDSKTAVVEMAQASGIQSVPKDRRNPMITTTYGTGELILAALDHDIQNLIVTIGGSATNDCGAGMLQALGAKITNSHGESIGFGGGCLGDVANIDFSGLCPKLKVINIKVACDVTNPLIGPNGATKVFGPQKGATPESVEQLERNMKHFADVIQKSLGISLHDVPGAGAAGGLGAALMLCGGHLLSGIDLVLDTCSFEEKLVGASYVLTGEGRIDGQTPFGKVISGIVKRAKSAGVPIIAFAGSITPGYESLYEEGLTSVHSITPYSCELDEALRSGRENLIRTVENVMRAIKSTQST